MRTVKRRSRSTQHPRIESLPIQALYQVGPLAKAIGVTHRRLQRLLKLEEVHVFRVGRFLLVPLTELETKVPDLWDSIKAAESFRRALDDT
jgi:hypothetical protein